MNLSSAFYAAGYLTGVVAFLLMAKRRRLLTDGVLTLMAVGLLGGLVCAALGQWLVAREPGKSVIAGLIGGYLCVHVAKRILGIRRPLGDLFAVALTAGEAIGRWGCLFAGCCYGRVCSLPWSIWQHGAHRHPTQIYSSIASLLMLVALLLFERRRPPENSVFYLQGLLFCASRFVIEYFREGPHGVGGLSAAQWACIAGAVFFAWQFRRLTAGRAHPPSLAGAEANS